MKVDVVDVFTHDGAGGNPCPVVCDAGAMTDAEMQAVALDHGHESGFVTTGDEGGFDYTFRFWVPNHEMEMCGHATIGALWLLASRDRTMSRTVRIRTLSGPVTGLIAFGKDGMPVVEISQPVGTVTDLGRAAENDVLAILGLNRSDLLDLPVQNAATSRVKTLVPVRNTERLNALAPDFSRMEGLCTAIGSTGLYPYALHEGAQQQFDARQFPKASGYPEDAATGIAASALTFGLLRNGLVAASTAPVTIMQGRAMGRLSRINTRFALSGGTVTGCFVGGAVVRAPSHR
ncbi:MAG: PhzF family phenazine biosynthesis protein [Proteobacteria bacterium]|nr:PhzF family phenazine biosynthesis protein [Pseudomonadota bacterium]